MSENEMTDREIEAIRAAAAKLPLVEPSRDLWPGIEARLGAQVVDVNHLAQRRPRAIVVSTRMLASAAAILMMATAGTTYLVLRDRLPAGGTVAGVAPGAQPVQGGLATQASLTVGGEFGAYTEEIDDLQGAIAERRSRLDPATIAVIERNLRIIDAAIEESRRALANDPASPLLTALLSEALANKVRLLRQAALLPPLT
jgi:ABC-type sugar transport system substrate-binding protein